MSEYHAAIEYLESLVEDELPELILELSEDELLAIQNYVEGVLEQERRGIDSLFESMTHTMKYIPNFLLQTLTTRFIEPPIAARITEKLEFKQTVAVAKGMSGAYLADVSRYLEPSFAAKLLESLPKKLANEVVNLAISLNPVKSLDIVEHLVKLKLTEKQLSALKLNLKGHSLSSVRRNRLENLG